MAKSTPKTETFSTFDRDGKYEIVHTATETVIATFSIEKGELAEETKDWANKLAKLTGPKLQQQYEEATGKKQEIIGRIIDVLGKKPEGNASYKPKAKGRESYSSSARLAFQPDNVTEKDKQILESVENLTARGEKPTFKAVADNIGVSVNVISGSASVLVAKGIVSTIRERVGDKVVRVFKIEMDWRNLTPRPPKPPKPPKEKKEKKQNNETAETAGA